MNDEIKNIFSFFDLYRRVICTMQGYNKKVEEIRCADKGDEMFQVLVAQSSHKLRVDSCIHKGMEIHFSYDANDCIRKMRKMSFHALVVKDDIKRKEGINVRSVLNLANELRIPVLLISQNLNEEMLDLLFNCSVQHYFMEPVSFQDLFDKLDKLRGKEEGLHLERKAGDLLHTLGIPNSVQGYSYLRDAIVSCCYHEEYMKGVTKRLYPLLANDHNTTAGAVEKSIRHAIEMAFSHSDQSQLYDFFKGTIRSDKAKATNAQFICMCVNYMKLEGL